MSDAPAMSEATSEFLRALASDTRQQMMLLFADGAARSVNEVAEALGIGQSTASEQLAILRRGRVVHAQREGKTVRYSADGAGISAALTELQNLLQTCCPPSPAGDKSDPLQVTASPAPR
ncbi:metalloregulator ArsR/SmtB family transcription factor [Micromonospora sp. NPDC050495]|uniref:ArsR/SmtB family transcription factor n=1 Tax=Micromonospora sp. NPDC050495 TaxID=3154936 RepID=UPI0033CC2163